MRGAEGARQALHARPLPHGAAIVAVPSLVVCLLSLSPLACAREGDRVDVTPSRFVGVPGPDTIGGRVRLAGNAPFTRTILEGDTGSVAVVGEYAAEVGRLSGAVVRASGEAQAGALGPEIRATSYEILSIDGERPLVGILAREGEEWLLVGSDGARRSLRAVPERFATLPGARLWIVVNEGGAVISYGVLRKAEDFRSQPRLFPRPRAR